MGVKNKLFFDANENFYDCDYLIFDSKFFKYSWGKKKLPETSCFFLNSKKKTNRLIFVTFLIAQVLSFQELLN